MSSGAADTVPCAEHICYTGHVTEAIGCPWEAGVGGRHLSRLSRGVWSEDTGQPAKRCTWTAPGPGTGRQSYPHGRGVSWGDPARPAPLGDSSWHCVPTVQAPQPGLSLRCQPQGGEGTATSKAKTSRRVTGTGYRRGRRGVDTGWASRQGRGWQGPVGQEAEPSEKEAAEGAWGGSGGPPPEAATGTAGLPAPPNLLHAGLVELIS